MVPYASEFLFRLESVPSKVAQTNICDEFGTVGRRFVVGSCCQGRICGTVHAYHYNGMKRTGGHSVPEEGRSSRKRPIQSGAADRQGPRISSAGWRARPPTVVCSKVSCTNIYDEFGVGGKRFFA